MEQLQAALTQAVKALASLKGEKLESGTTDPTTEVVVAKTVETAGTAATEAHKTTPDDQKGGKRKTRKGKGKRKLNGYMKFANTQRAKLISANPGKAMSEIGKMLGAAWHKLSASEKAAFG